MEKLNIGLFIDTWFPMVDGVINVVDNYAKRLCKFANVTVFAPKVNKNYTGSNLPYKIVFCKSTKFFNLDYRLPLPKLDKNFKKEIKAANLDVIHIHSPFSIGKMAAKFGNKNKIPVISTFHSQFKQDFMRATKSKLITKLLLKIITKVFNRSNLLLTMNPKCAEIIKSYGNPKCSEIIKSYGYKGRIELLPNGTDLAPNQNLTDLIAKIKKINNLTDEKILINIGRLTKLKNIDLVIDSCKILKQENFHFKLFIVGGGQDEKYFKKKVNANNLSKEIVFVGKILDQSLKSAYLASADLNVFPSFYDTDGIVKIEAAAFETPTLFAKGSVASSSCKDNVNGYISEAKPNSFAKKITEIFDDNNYFAVCKQAKNDLYLSWDGVVEKLLKIYLKEKKND